MKSHPIPQSISQYIAYDPVTGVLRWIKKPNRRIRIGDEAGRSVTEWGYRTLRFEGRAYFAHRVAWYLYYGEQPPAVLDHRNNDPADNRIMNLRKATPRENAWNVGMTRRNSTGFKGVTRHKRTGRYQAQVNLYGRNLYLGTFVSPEEAAAVADEFRRANHGQFYRKVG